MTSTQRNQVSLERAVQGIGMLKRLHDQAGDYLRECGNSPTMGSIAKVELKTHSDPARLIDAYSQGILLTEVAGDHLMAFTKTVTEPIQTIAPWASVRGVMESSALASWLLDPDIDVTQRVERSFAFRLKGLSEQVKFYRAAGDTIAMNRAQIRLNEVTHQAQKLDCTRLEIAFTQVIADVLNAEPEYRLLSAMTHAHTWAVQQLGFHKVEGVPDHLIEGLDKRFRGPILDKHLSPEAIIFLSAVVLDVFPKPVCYKSKLFGYDTTPFEAIVNSAVRNLGVSRRDFWN